jgi:hypothetical protein
VQETVDDFIDEDYLQQAWGGGKYMLRIKRMKENGSYVFATTRTVKIAGDPKIERLMRNRRHARTDDDDGLTPVAAAGPPVDVALAGKAMDVMANSLERERERSDRAPVGPDMAMFQALLEPFKLQLAQANQRAIQLEQRLFDRDSRPPQQSMGDRIAEKMIDGESSRIAGLTAQFQSERRQLEDRHASDLKEVRERHREELRERERQHERELKRLEDNAGSQKEASKAGHDARIDGLKSEIHRLERELTEARARIGTLEGKKDKTIGDSIDEIVKLKGSLETLGIGGDDEDGAPWYERIARSALESDKLMGLAANIFGGAQGGGQQQLPPPGGPPPGQPFQTPDGAVYVVQPDGSTQMLSPPGTGQAPPPPAPRRKRREAAGHAQEPSGAAPAAPAPAAPAGRPPDGKQIEMAVTFLEQAVNANSDPVQVAQTARTLIPGDVLTFIKGMGVEHFLRSVAESKPDSPLATQVGRNFVRKMAKALGLGGG